MSKKNCIFSAFWVKNEFFPKFDDTEWFVLYVPVMQIYNKAAAVG
jgi:hypothetical protein